MTTYKISNEFHQPVLDWSLRVGRFVRIRETVQLAEEKFLRCYACLQMPVLRASCILDFVRSFGRLMEAEDTCILDPSVCGVLF